MAVRVGRVRVSVVGATMGGMNPEPVIVYTDGSCAKTSWDGTAWVGPGGWAWWVSDTCFDHGSLEKTTAERMELLAIVQALQSPHVFKADRTVVVRSDHQTTVEMLASGRAWDLQAGGWLTKNQAKKSARSRRDFPVAYWDRLLEVLEPRRDRVTFEWVKGHAGDEGNERADQLAGQARKRRVTV